MEKSIIDKYEFTCEYNTFSMPSGLKIEYSAAIGQCGRKNQEDRLAIYFKDNYLGFGIYDGHGDDDHGRNPTGHIVAEKLADPKTGLLPFILDSKDPLSREMIIEKFKEYDQTYFKESKAGSTAVIFTLDNNGKIFIAYCGDSQALLINPKTVTILCQTVDHDAKSEDERKRIRNAGGIVYEGRICGANETLAVSRSFGDQEFEDLDENQTRNGQKLIIPDPEVFEGKVTDDPIVGLSYSDGLSNYYSSDSRKKPKEFKNKLASLVHLLIQNGRPIETLSTDLIKLMNRSKTMQQIIDEVRAKNVNLDTAKDFESTSCLHLSSREDNLSLIVFRIEKSKEVLNLIKKELTESEPMDKDKTPPKLKEPQKKEVETSTTTDKSVLEKNSATEPVIQTVFQSLKKLQKDISKIPIPRAPKDSGIFTKVLNILSKKFPFLSSKKVWLGGLACGGLLLCAYLIRSFGIKQVG
jgi:serine/threonine protein phosphatase PrpC